MGIGNAEDFALVEQIGTNPDNLESLRGDWLGDGVTLFVGAGVSVPFGLPQWGQFLLGCARLFGKEAEVQAQLVAFQYEEAAETCICARTPQQFQDRLRATFGAQRLGQVRLEGTAGLLPKLANGPVLTTNFDRVLETVFELSEKPFRDRYWGEAVDAAAEAFRQRELVLLKLHGDVEDPSNRVLTRAEYLKHYGLGDDRKVDRTKPMVRLLRQAAFRKPFLFLGCSLEQDRTMAVLESVFKEDPELTHYAVLEKPDTEEAFQKRAEFLAKHGIGRPIWFPKGRFDLIPVILEHVLGSEGGSGPRKAGQKLALVVSVCRYDKAGLADRAGAEKVAEVVCRELQRETAKFEVRRLTEPTSQQVKIALRQIHRDSAEGDLVVFYYLGKAEITERSGVYLCTGDTDAKYLEDSSVSLGDLRRLIDEEARSRQVALIMDCPFVGDEKADVGRVIEDQLAKGHGKWVLSATDKAGADVAEQDGAGSIGLLVARAAGSGLEADRNNDGVVTLQELYEFVAAARVGQGQPRSWTFDILPGEIELARGTRVWTAVAPLPLVDQVALDSVRQRLTNQKVIPFIGTGIYGGGPLSGFALAAAMAQEAKLISDEPQPLATVAEYVERQLDDRALTLARLEVLLEKGKREVGRVGAHELMRKLKPPVLIISGTYDWVFEGALDAAGEPYVAVGHVMRAENPEDEGKILVARRGPELAAELCSASDVRLDEKKDRVIYKVMGSPYLSRMYQRSWVDTCVLTEMDHLTFLGRVENQRRRIPSAFGTFFARCSLLFLGYGLDVWQYRLVMHLMQAINVKDVFAVRQPVSQMETLCWECLKARIVGADPEGFVRNLGL